MSTNSCIKNLLKFICLLQNNSTNSCILDEGCSKPFLGPTINNDCYNTRVISLYTKNGEIFNATYTDENNNQLTSSLFRVTSINNDCCKLLILTNNNGEYLSTNQYTTIKISCICAIQCLEDVIIENLCMRGGLN